MYAVALPLPNFKFDNAFCINLNCLMLSSFVITIMIILLLIHVYYFS